MTVAYRSFSLCVDVLMAKEMYKYKIAVGIVAPLGSCPTMVDLHLFIVKE